MKGSRTGERKWSCETISDSMRSSGDDMAFQSCPKSAHGAQDFVLSQWSVIEKEFFWKKGVILIKALPVEADG